MLGLGLPYVARGRSFATLDFAGGVFAFAGQTYPSFADFLTGTGSTFTRASAKTYAAASGLVSTVSSGQPAIGGLGLLYEPASANEVRNSTHTGAAAGSPGTLQGSWATTLSGTTRTLATGTDATTGLPYLSCRWAGTTNTANGLLMDMEGTQIIAAVTGETWATSSWLALDAGSLTGVNAVRLEMTERDAAGAALVTLNGPNITLSATPTRHAFAAATGHASCAFVRPRLRLLVNSGVAVDVTVRFVGPQAEKRAGATSLVQTTSAAVTRAADALTLALGAAPVDLTVTFDDGSTASLPGVSGSYAVPTNLARPHIRRIEGRLAA